jgi:DeoR/GlpR family transcriptional regulator of sugar metabolism
VASDGWRGANHFASLLGVSESTIRRDLNALVVEGRIIRRKYGGYLADPTGILLKERPWIAWG